jgi:hypothetical protein
VAAGFGDVQHLDFSGLVDWCLVAGAWWRLDVEKWSVWVVMPARGSLEAEAAVATEDTEATEPARLEISREGAKAQRFDGAEGRSFCLSLFCQKQFEGKNG